MLDRCGRIVAISSISASLALCGLNASNAAEIAFTNPPLKAQGLPDSQYQAIGRGHAADCQARSMEIAAKSYPEPANNASRSTYQGVIGDSAVSGTIETRPARSNPFMEGVEDERHRQARVAMENSIYLGCMSEKGWIRISN